MADATQLDLNHHSFSRATRRRTALACSACRTRKSKCNGARPKCESCQKMGFECAYEIPSSAANLIISRDYIKNLESRLRVLERLATSRIDEASIANEEDLSSTPSSVDVDDIENDASDNQGALIINVQPMASDEQAETDDTDGMAVSLVDDNDPGYFGPSSNISLMRIIFQAVARRGYVRESLSFPSTGRSHAKTITRPARIMPGSPSKSQDMGSCNHLPPDGRTKELIRQYFSTTGMLFPYIHEPSFMETYEHLKKQNFRVGVRRSWLALLNIMLAMASCGGCQDAVDSKTLESDIFYRRSQELCGNQILVGATLESVQYLLLTSQYLQGTQKAAQTWTMHGLAVKAALSIGLHSQQKSGLQSSIEQEMRKRTWYGCVILDRSLSMTYGRPSTIPEDYVLLELPVVIAGDFDESGSVSFFSATIKLYKILWKIMGSLYGHNLRYGENSTASTITRILELQQELNEWCYMLPACLSLVSYNDIPERVEANPGTPNLQRYRIILTLRYLNTKLLLHRPLLTRGLLQNPSDSSQDQRLLDQTGENIIQCCTQSAKEIIMLVHGVLNCKNLGKSYLGSRWFTIYYIFNAGLVVFGSFLGPQHGSKGGFGGSQKLEHGKQVLAKAIEAFSSIGNGIALIDRCTACLRRLLQILEEWAIFPITSNPTALFAAQINQTILTSDIGDSSLVMGLSPFENDLQLTEGLEFEPSNEFQRWFSTTPWQNN